MNSINEISYYLQILDAIKHITDDNFFFHKCIVCNTIQLSENVIFAFPGKLSVICPQNT